MFDEYFKTTDYEKLNNNNKHKFSTDIQLVKGSDFHKNFYDLPDKNLVENITVRYYQIAMFDEFGKCAIRSFLFFGSSSKGACFFDYQIIEVLNYKLSKDYVDKFVKYLDKSKPKSKIKIIYKFHPVYNFDFINPPTGEDINQCQSELLN